MQNLKKISEFTLAKIMVSNLKKKKNSGISYSAGWKKWGDMNDFNF